MGWGDILYETDKWGGRPTRKRLKIALSSAVSTPLWWIFKKCANIAIHSRRITCKRSESAGEWRIAL